jgi:hypothetical protein
MVLAGIGSVPLLLVLAMLVLPVVIVLDAPELRLQGRRVQARFHSVERDRSVERHGVHPWRIVCQWHDPATGKAHLFKSPKLWFDPVTHVEAREFTVFVNPQLPSNYTMDVDFLPKLTT